MRNLIKDSLLVVALSAIVSGCALFSNRNIISLGYLEKKGQLTRVDFEKYVLSEEAWDSTLTFYNNKYNLRDLEVLDENGNVIGRFAYGRMEGLHYRQFATNKDLLIEENVTEDTLPYNYRLRNF